MHLGGRGAGEDHPVDPGHEGRHAGAVRPAVRLRRVPLRAPVRRHAGGAAGGGAEAVERHAVAGPAQDHLRPHQGPLPLRLLHRGNVNSNENGFFYYA